MTAAWWARQGLKLRPPGCESASPCLWRSASLQRPSVVLAEDRVLFCIDGAQQPPTLRVVLTQGPQLGGERLWQRDGPPGGFGLRRFEELLPAEALEGLTNGERAHGQVDVG